MMARDAIAGGPFDVRFVSSKSSNGSAGGQAELSLVMLPLKSADKGPRGSTKLLISFKSL